VIRRPLLLGGALVIAFAQFAFADGDYQLTRNGRTLVWNNHLKHGDEATWSGRRDRNGYAQGFGNLVWYTKVRGFDEPVLYARYWGRMANGKFEGPVNAHTKQKTLHAFFVEGARATRWSAGTAPASPTPKQQLALSAARQRASVGARQRVEPATAQEPPAPAEGPLRKAEGGRMKEEVGPEVEITNYREGNIEINGSPPEVRSLGGDAPETPGWPKIDADQSIKLLALPPRTLKSVTSDR
jgi:hypothetical protein